ncbi:hypothetical protein [Stenotrophomonas cyclobalanopsidis]|uniref:hypothetical protein n=1 Tax=Stenotrophomonas cyclobalanopsidis TaxID=2771362 RepID=UPI0034613FF2
MRSAMLLMMTVSLLGCSRQTPSDDAAAVTLSADAAAADADRPAASHGEDGLASQAVDPLYGAVAADGETPSRLLNRYVLDLLNRDKAGIDAAWAIAPPDARRADDAALRLLPDVRNLRLDSEPAVPRDEQQPPRLLEVPVRIRATTGKGVFRYHGWYRVQPRADGQGWQIQSAQLQPTLD